MQIDSIITSELVTLRQELHKHPELSGYEFNTQEIIKKFLVSFNPTKIVEQIGGQGIAFIFEGTEAGPTIAIRADMDALPIQEINEFDYKSINEGVAHKCGHDGHMTMVAGLALIIAQQPIKKGKLILFFQPAEETGQGAKSMVNDNKFKDLKIDYIFGLHNLPGYPTGSLVLINKTFAAASTGLIIKLKGKTSHAAEPENGNSPAIAMANIVKDITYLPQYQEFKNLVVSTVIHAKLGEIAFGTTPGYAEVMATLRSYDNTDFELLREKALAIAKNHCHINKLKFEAKFVEEFPATINKSKNYTLIKHLVKKCEFEIIEKQDAFRWSEDFGHFLNNYEGAFFGLGSGINHAQLHNPDYDFPDEIIPYGLTVFNAIISHFNR